MSAGSGVLPATFIQAISIVLTLAALAAYLNHRYLHWPTTIGIMAISLAGSLGLILLGVLGIVNVEEAKQVVESVNFDQILLHGMLAFLLFAVALNVDLTSLRNAKLAISVLATVGVVMATFFIGGLFWLVAHWVGFDLPFLYALLFGALISPTDAVAVVGILKTAGASRELETNISGEALFNDGTAVVVFLTVLGIATSQETPTWTGIGTFFIREALGGAALGLLLGWVTYRLLNSVDSYKVEVLLTLALVAGGYALALALGVSGPIAIIVAGLVIGNQARQHAMSETVRTYLDSFWELIDETLNAVLFILIGMEIIVITVLPSYILAGVIAIVVVLLGRLVSVAVPVNLLRIFARQAFGRGTVTALTWGGLRGGISIALALSIPPSAERDLIVSVTYIVVIFSILIQGLSLSWVIQRVARSGAR